MSESPTGAPANSSPTRSDVVDEPTCDPASPPRQTLKGHPLALKIYAEVRDRSEADRQLIYSAAVSRSPALVLDANKELAAEALRRFLGARDEAAAGASSSGEDVPRWAAGEPTGHRYRHFRDLRPVHKEWPSEQFIINALGPWTWKQALAAIGAGARVDVLSVRLRSLGPAFIDEEIETALRTWIAEVDRRHGTEAPLTGEGYQAWAARENSAPSSGPTRWPRKQTVRRHWGLWPAILVRLGQLHRWSAAISARETVTNAGLPPLQFDISRIPLPDNCDPGTQHVWWPAKDPVALEALTWVAGHIPAEQRRRFPCDVYRVRCAQAKLAGVAQGWALEFPSAQTLMGIAGSWPEARVQAGLASASEGGAISYYFSDADLIEAVSSALGPDFSDIDAAGAGRRYEAWRAAELAAGRRRPSEKVLRRRLGQPGGWDGVLARVAEETQGRDAETDR